ncbi:glutathione S-transferase N-terminal domain-containing protein [Candidatus Thalassolituus haligoni]|uniref:glutathione S-transferase N-terminal domain-containing protein n=1 Tax=Candidatus Thalassolituus haligoni TaxID=3100113 RepID=UPI003511DBB0
MLDEFPITQRWPANNPDIIQLYSVDTPNGLKVSAMLEETGLPYEKHSLSFSHADQHSPEFLALNPNNKIPAIIDPHGPDGKPLALWESGAILLYLAEKSGRFLPTGRHARYETIQWLMWQMGGVGPMFGQFGFFQKFGGADWEDKRALARYQDETGRLLKVLNQRLSDHRYVMGDNYSIADIWVRALSKVYDAKQVLELESYHHVTQWLNLCMERTGSVAVLTP